MFGLNKSSLFSDTKKLEREIDGFVDILSEVGLVFKSIVQPISTIQPMVNLMKWLKKLKKWRVKQIK